MIYVVLYPDTLLERLKFALFGTAPSICCNDIRNGPGVVECEVGEDACRVIPFDRVIEIIWDSGYKQALANVQAEYHAQMLKKIGMCGMEEEDDDGGEEAPDAGRFPDLQPAGYN